MGPWLKYAQFVQRIEIGFPAYRPDGLGLPVTLGTRALTSSSGLWCHLPSMAFSNTRIQMQLK